MPVQDVNNSNDYLRVKRVYVDSADRVTDADLNTFRVELDEEVQNAVGIELTGFSINNNTIPSFVAGIPGRAGDNIIDFFITNTDLGDPDYGLSTTFEIEMDEVRYDYYNPDNLTRSYTDKLQETMNGLLQADPYWGAQTPFVTVFEDDLGRTDIDISTLGLDTVWGFNFATGPNATTSPHIQMGFENQDYSSTDDRLISPNRVNLRVYRYISVSVEEFRELSPVANIYADDGGGYTSNERNTARTRIISSDRLHRIRYLTITPLLNGSIHVPGGSLMDFEFTIFHLSNQGDKPEWFKERLAA